MTGEYCERTSVPKERVPRSYGDQVFDSPRAYTGRMADAPMGSWEFERNLIERLKSRDFLHHRDYISTGTAVSAHTQKERRSA